MLTRRTVILPVLAAPLLLAQINIQGCLPSLGGGGGNNGGAVFNLPPTVIISADVTRGVAPLTVKFDSSASTDDGVIVTRQWNFGDNQSSPEIAPTHTFQTTGQFKVTLTLTDDRGASAAKSVTISVTERPVPVFLVDRTAAESAPAVFNFDGSQSFDPDGTITSYQWDFDDGSRELLPVVSHTFASPGTFQVKLTVTDNTGVTANTSRIIEVGIPRPTISFRSPASDLENIVASLDSPLWVHATYNVTADVPYNIRVGLDGDNDQCEAQSALFTAETGAEVFRMPGHTAPVRSVAFSPDRNYIISSGDDGTTRVHNAANGNLIASYSGLGGTISSSAVSADSTAFVVGTSDRNVVLRNLVNGTLLGQFAGHTGSVNGVAINTSGNRIVSGDNDGIAIVWDVPSVSQVQTLTGHTAAVNSVAFSTANQAIVVTGSDDQTAKIWNATTGALLLTLAPVFQNGQLVSGHSNSVTSVAFSPDGTRVATASVDRTAKLWDTATGAEILTFTGHNDRLTSVAFSPDGTQVITGSGDGTARIWSVATGAQVRALQPCASSISSVAFSPDGTQVLLGVAAGNDIQLDTDPPTGNDVNLRVPQAYSLAGATAGRQYFLWAELDTDRTTPVRTYATATVSVIPPYTSGIDDFTPRIPLVNDQAAVVVEPRPTRQVFDLGPLREGDRLNIAPMIVPGYSANYGETGDYAVLILDADQKMFALYDNSRMFFTPNSRPTLGHNSSKYLVVVDGGLGLRIGVSRGEGIRKRSQRVFIDYRAAQIAVGGQPPQNIDAFNASDLNGSWGSAETSQIKAAIRATIDSFFAPYNLTVSTSDDGGIEPPFNTMYVTSFGEAFDYTPYGIVDFIDPRNETQTGKIQVDAAKILDDFGGLSATDLGNAIGRVAVQQISFMLGLRKTTGISDVMAENASPIDGALSFQAAPISSSEMPNGAIGTQDAPLLLTELLGTR